MEKSSQASVLSSKDWQKLESVCDIDHMKVIWGLLRYTGARINEVLLLKFEDVYTISSRIKIHDAITYRKKNQQGKDKFHTVPICSQLRLLLEGYVQPIKSEWLFPSPQDSSKPISYEAVLRFLKRKAIQAGLENLRITTHSGRRSCIVELARQGTDIKTIQAISGHSSLENLAKYIELDPERTKNALEGIF